MHLGCFRGEVGNIFTLQNYLAVITLENGNFNCNDLSFRISLLGKCLCPVHSIVSLPSALNCAKTVPSP